MRLRHLHRDEGDENRSGSKKAGRSSQCDPGEGKGEGAEEPSYPVAASMDGCLHQTTTQLVPAQVVASAPMVESGPSEAATIASFAIRSSHTA